MQLTPLCISPSNSSFLITSLLNCPYLKTVIHELCFILGGFLHARVFLYGVQDPRCHHSHVGVHAILVRACAPVAPGHYTSQVPISATLTGQRSTAVKLTCVNTAILKASTEGSAVNGTIVGLNRVANAGWDQTHFSFPQNIWLAAIPL